MCVASLYWIYTASFPWRPQGSMWQLLSSKGYFNIMSLTLSPTERKQTLIHLPRKPSLILWKPSPTHKCTTPKQGDCHWDWEQNWEPSHRGAFSLKGIYAKEKHLLFFPMKPLCCRMGEWRWHRQWCRIGGSFSKESQQRREVSVKAEWSQQPWMGTQA